MSLEMTGAYGLKFGLIPLACTQHCLDVHLDKDRNRFRGPLRPPRQLLRSIDAAITTILCLPDDAAWVSEPFTDPLAFGWLLMAREGRHLDEEVAGWAEAILAKPRYRTFGDSGDALSQSVFNRFMRMPDFARKALVTTLVYGDDDGEDEEQATNTEGETE